VRVQGLPDRPLFSTSLNMVISATFVLPLPVGAITYSRDKKSGVQGCKRADFRFIAGHLFGTSKAYSHDFSHAVGKKPGSGDRSQRALKPELLWRIIIPLSSTLRVSIVDEF